MPEPIYKRILLKLSGEALAGDNSFGLNVGVIEEVCRQIVAVANLDVEVCVVVGGGNIWRGRFGENMEQSTADYMGMLATTINALALQDAIERMGVPVRVQSAIAMQQICEPYIRRKAIRHLEKKRVVVFAAGIGSPFFSTDTAAALRAAEMNAEIVLSAKNVDGVYDADPASHPEAVKFDELTHADILSRGLKVIDATAASLCLDNKIPILIFSLRDPANILRAVCGEKIGTMIR